MFKSDWKLAGLVPSAKHPGNPAIAILNHRRVEFYYLRLRLLERARALYIEA